MDTQNNPVVVPPGGQLEISVIAVVTPGVLIINTISLNSLPLHDWPVYHNLISATLSYATHDGSNIKPLILDSTLQLYRLRLVFDSGYYCVQLECCAVTDTEAGSGTAPGVYLKEDPISGTQLENQSELRAPTVQCAAYYLDAAIAARTIPGECHWYHHHLVNGTSTNE